MASLGELAKLAQIIANQSPEQMVILRAMVKEAADQNDPKRWQKTLDSIGVKAPKSKNASEEDETPGQDEAIKAKKEEEDEKPTSKEAGSIKGPGKPDGTGPCSGTPQCQMSEEKKEKEGEEEEDKEEKGASILGELDNIAGELEATGDYELFKMAYQLDQVAEVLEGKKTAATLESEPDEKYMREAFECAIQQKEKDEKYMESFATDRTQEVYKAYAKRPYGIVK